MKESLDGSLLNKYILNNHRYALKDHQDWMTLVCGSEGAGKSTMAAQAILWYDPAFDPTTQTIYDAESLMNFYDLYEDVPGKVGWLDEAVSILLGEDNNTEEARLFKKMFVTHRDLEKRYVLCAPSPWLLAPYYRQWRVRDFIMVYIDQMSMNFNRRAAYYSRASYIPFVVNNQAKTMIALPQKFIKKYKPTLDLDFPKFHNKVFDDLFSKVRVLKREFQQGLRKDIKELIKSKAEAQNKAPKLQDHEIIEEVRGNIDRYIGEYNNRRFLNAGLIAADYSIGGARANRIKQVLAVEVIE